jgi:hypothetical protein
MQFCSILQLCQQDFTSRIITTDDHRALKGYFAALESDENRGVNTARGVACEYVAWRFVTHLSGRELIHFLLYELPPLSTIANGYDEEAGVQQQGSSISSTQPQDDSQASLLDSSRLEHGEGIQETQENNMNGDSASDNGFAELATSFDNLNALEVAAVTNAKKFLSQRVVQRIIESIWRGDIVFWETLGVGSEKEAKIYNKRSV